jgi:hypothetical protein
MAGSREESWWQAPKQFAPARERAGDADEPTWDDVEDEPDTAQVMTAEVDEDELFREPAELDEESPELDEEVPERHEALDHDEIELEDDPSSTPPVGWTSPSGDVIPKESSNQRFFVGVALIVVATTIGVLFALTLGTSGDDGGALEPAVTSSPLDVRGATTIRPGGLSPICEAEQTRVQQAEEAYQRGSIAGQYTDMAGLVGSGKLAAPSTLFVITNEEVGEPAVVSFAGTSAREFADYLVLPIPDGPCDTT